MSEIVERVARAIAAAKRGLADVPGNPIIDRVWPSYVGQARAAIEAMRTDTTRAMRLAAALADGGDG